MAWYRRFLNLVRPEKLSSDLDREMAFHIEERTDDLRAIGLDDSAAAREARRMFGNPTRKKEEARDVDVLGWLDSLFRDVRYALRALAASPAFTLVAVLSLALGIGANTAIFSLTDALVLKSLPVQHPEQLLEVNMGEAGNDYLTNPLWEQIRDNVTVFSGVFAYSDAQFNLAPGGEVRMANGAWVSGDFFNVLGVRPETGRLLQRADDVPGCGATAAVSDAFARREFGDPASAPGKTITLADHPVTVVGVADPAFFGIQVGRTADVYVPICMQSMLIRPGILDVRARWFLNIIGRPKPGLSPEQVHAALAVAAPAIYRATLPANWGASVKAEYLKRTFDVVPAATGLSDLRRSYRSALYVLMVVVGIVLLIACANIANLLLARGASRAHELSIRMALGAGRWRLTRQLLTESLLLSLMGAALGVLFARWASGLLVRLLSTRENFVSLDLNIDGRVLAFTAAVAAGTAVLFGLLPAWRATRVDPQTAMKGGGRGIVGDTRHRLGKALVVAQVALSLTLVAAAGLLLGSFRKLTQVDPGFHQDGVLLVSAGFAQARHDGEQRMIAQEQLLARVRELPCVRTASASFITPLGRGGWNEEIAVDGYQSKGESNAVVWFNQVSDGYFRTLETSFLAGRDLAESDGPSAPLVAVIDETMARKYFGSVNALGRTFRTRSGDSTNAPITIIGIVRTAKYASLKEDSPGTAYVPFAQGDGKGATANYEIRTAGAPLALIPLVKSATTEISPAVTLDFTTLREQVSSSLSRPRVLATLSAFFGALALLLATIGLYGTMSYDVTRRRNEIGIRIALGAASHRVLGMVVAEAGRLILIGVGAGLLLALAMTRFVSSFVFGLTPTDPPTLAIASVVLCVVALAAAFLPAWRAARVDPMNALREE